MLARFMHPLVTFDGDEPAGAVATPPAPATPAPAVVTPPVDPPKDPGPDPAFAEQRRRADEAERRAKAAEDKLAEQERQKAEEEGRWKEIAEKAEADKKDLEAKLAKTAQDAELATIASGLKFHNPADVLHRLTAEERGDPVKAKAALEQIAKTDKYLVQSEPVVPPEIGRVLDPAAQHQKDPPKAPLTAEAIKAMTPEQIAAEPPEALAEAMQRG